MQACYRLPANGQRRRNHRRRRKNTSRVTMLRAGRSISICILALLAILSGCSRTRYRIQADNDVGGLVAEKSNDPRWAYPGFPIYLDPRSRFFDSTNPDRPPMPQDDPAAHEFMHRVYGMRGYPRWHENGDRWELENPEWVKLLPTYANLTDRGEVILSIDSSMKLAQIHSPDFRQQIDTLYLSALDVSAERFRFDTQFYGGTGLLFTHAGRDRVPAVGEQNTLSLSTQNLTNLGGTNTQAQRRIATGGELVVGFANSMVWQFAGPDEYTNLSILNFNFVQPLLRFGGRAVALERLTIAERNLLANLRAFTRYRQGFYTNVVIGDLNVTGPQRRGGFFGGTGLDGFSGQGGGGFGEVGGATNFGRAGFGGTAAGGGAAAGGAGFAGGGAGNVGGFVGLLQISQQIRNSQDALDLQLRTLKLLEANLEAGLIDIVQVDQFRQNIETERANLLQSEVGLENNLDTFKRQTLGLPPNLSMHLDDTMIQQFQFVAPDTSRYLNQLADFSERLGVLPAIPPEAAVREAIEQYAQLREQAPARFQQVQADLAQLAAAVPRRERVMATDQQRNAFSAEQTRLNQVLKGLQQRYEIGGADLMALRMQLNATNTVATLEDLVALTSSHASLVNELSLVQIGARLESVTIEPVELEPEQALEIARANRLDWMNNRATLVDTWRLITFNANALKSNLQVTLSGDIQTDGNDPLRFQAPTGTMRAGLRFDAPFTRLLERNNYRQVLIDYQQDRQTLIRYEDGVNQTLRQDIRQLDQLRENLDIQRRAVAIAVRRVDKTREDLNEPPPPVQPGQPSVQLGPTASLNLLTAISDLRNSQNNFISVWLNYYSERLQLMRDLGLMQIDENGVWIDLPLEQALGADVDDLFPLPPPIPESWLRDAEIDPRNVLPSEIPSENVPVPGTNLPAPKEGFKAIPGDLPAVRSTKHMREIEKSEKEAEQLELNRPANDPAEAPQASTNRFQRGRIRGSAKRWVDMVRQHRNGPPDLEKSVY